MKEFTSKGPRERAMNEKMAVRFGICGTKPNTSRGQNKIWVQRLEAIFGESTTLSNFSKGNLES